MDTRELQIRLQNILTGIIGENSPKHKDIQPLLQDFLEDYIPNIPMVITVTDIEGYPMPMVEYFAWDEDEDGPIQGIKLFKDLEIYLNHEFCEY